MVRSEDAAAADEVRMVKVSMAGVEVDLSGLTPTTYAVDGGSRGVPPAIDARRAQLVLRARRRRVPPRRRDLLVVCYLLLATLIGPVLGNLRVVPAPGGFRRSVCLPPAT